MPNSSAKFETQVLFLRRLSLIRSFDKCILRMESSLLNPSIMSLYHAGLSRLQPGAAPPTLGLIGAHPFRPALSMWPHPAPLSHGLPQNTGISPNFSFNLSKPVQSMQNDDSCGGSSASNASDTNGSGDEVNSIELHFHIYA